MLEKKQGAKYLEEYVSVRFIIRQSSLPLLICIIFDMFAGVVLGSMEGALSILPGLLVLIPPLLDERGNIAGAFGSRLGSALHQGLIRPDLRGDKNLVHSVAASLGEGATMAVVIASLAYVTMLVLGRESIGIISLVAISLMVWALSAFILISLVMVFAFTVFKHGIDPDNVMGPMVTSAGDVLTVLALFIAVRIIMGVV
ncbi:MAG: magnesium transporter [Methanocellales archaeon]|nr:magnesium transporter [Methanocellales archaeon]